MEGSQTWKRNVFDHVLKFDSRKTSSSSSLYVLQENLECMIRETRNGTAGITLIFFGEPPEKKIGSGNLRLIHLELVR